MAEVVVDTNVLISGLLKGRSTRAIIEALVNNKFRLVISNDLLNELTFTLRKPALASLISEFDSAALITLIKESARFVQPRQKLTLCRDPKDDKFLEAALEGAADFLVSGDKDLLFLKSLQKTRILSPAEFIKLIKS